MSENEKPRVAETPLLKKLNEQRIKAAFDRKEYLERAANGEEMSGEDTASYEKACKNIDRFGGLIEDEIRRIELDKDIDASYNAMREKLRESAAPAGRSDGVGEKRLSVAEAMRADIKAAANGERVRNNGTYVHLPETRDYTKGTSTKGAELIPTTLSSVLYETMFNDSEVMSLGCDIIRTQSGETIKMPRLTGLGALTVGAPGAGSARVAEGGTIQESEGTFDQVQLDAYKYGHVIDVTRELIEDGVLDIEALMGRLLGRNMANYLGYDLTLGNGSSCPRGFRSVVPTAHKVDSASGGAFPTDFDKFFDVIAKLHPSYRRRAKWVVNDSATFTLRKIRVESAHVEYAWEPNLQGAGMPDRFLGYPIVTDSNIPVPASAAGVTAVFADFSAYMIRLIRDVRVEWSTEKAWVEDLVSVKAVVRADGDAIDDEAFAAYNSIT